MPCTAGLIRCDEWKAERSEQVKPLGGLRIISFSPERISARAKVMKFTNLQTKHEGFLHYAERTRQTESELQRDTLCNKSTLLSSQLHNTKAVSVQQGCFDTRCMLNQKEPCQKYF